MITFSNKNNSALIAYKRKTGKLIKLAEGVYSSDVNTPVRDQIIEYIGQILSHLEVKGVLAWQSALGIKSEHDTIYLEGTSIKNLKLEGGVSVSVIPRKWANPSFMNIHLSPIDEGAEILKPSFYRAILENLSVSKVLAKRSDRDGALRMLEHHLGVVAKGNPGGLNADLRVFENVGVKMGLQDEVSEVRSRFNSFVAHLAQSKAVFAPVDTTRLALFSAAAERLSISASAIAIQSKRDTKQAGAHAFLESYFSNYIEGAEFEVEEAEKIVYEDGYNEKHPRSKDGHDVIALYQLINDPSLSLSDADSLIKAVRGWHEVLMRHRLASAGQFKQMANRAGNTRFVAPELVNETLRQGFSLIKDLPPGLARGALLKLVFTEVHPFDDGNGRISRLLLNNELSFNGLDRMIVPTVFREDYMLAMKAFSQQGNLFPFERMLSKLAVINASIPRDIHQVQPLVERLREMSAFCLPSESMWGLPPPQPPMDAESQVFKM